MGKLLRRISVSYTHLDVYKRQALNEAETVESEVIRNLNGLSDYLFVLSCKMAQDFGEEEIKWAGRKN